MVCGGFGFFQIRQFIILLPSALFIALHFTRLRFFYQRLLWLFSNFAPVARRDVIICQANPKVVFAKPHRDFRPTFRLHFFFVFPKNIHFFLGFAIYKKGRSLSVVNWKHGPAGGVAINLVLPVPNVGTDIDGIPFGPIPIYRPNETALQRCEFVYCKKRSVKKWHGFSSGVVVKEP